MQMQTTATIRDRWQITIPDEIRKMLEWAKPKSVVSVSITALKELIIKPFESKQEKITDWKEVWGAINEARAISSKGKKISLSEFIIKDREQHRI